MNDLVSHRVALLDFYSLDNSRSSLPLRTNFIMSQAFALTCSCYLLDWNLPSVISHSFTPSLTSSLVPCMDFHFLPFTTANNMPFFQPVLNHNSTAAETVVWNWLHPVVLSTHPWLVACTLAATDLLIATLAQCQLLKCGTQVQPAVRLLR